MLDDAANGRFTMVQVVREIDWPGSPVAWIERYVSEVGVTVEALRDKGGPSLTEELIDDVMERLASVSGRFYRSKQNQHRIRSDAAARLGKG
ncbi:hypothetical protein ACFWAY_29725 [Rhodococcus sp. NPDC059968]|uniref:hypothetical protein n=1 Tax=Rhodococcus sp. NPDC059968 TaxID=3347017 RepID=UPI0036728ED0